MNEIYWYCVKCKVAVTTENCGCGSRVENELGSGFCDKCCCKQGPCSATTSKELELEE